MSKRIDDQFDALIQDALEAADGIKTPLEDYIRQMRSWQSQISTRIDLAISDLARRASRERSE